MTPRILLFVFSIGLSLSARASVPWVRDTWVEVLLKRVYAPSRGFDDNDRIEVVARGYLPNPCYSVGNTSFAWAQDGRTFDLHHFALRQMNGPCEGADRPDQADPVPFLSTVSLGQLAEGDYRAKLNAGSPAEAKVFHVDAARDPYNIDNFKYAAVSAVETAEIFGPGEEVRFVLSGVFTSSCDEFARPLAAEVQDDVIVVLPALQPAESPTFCHAENRPFKEEIRLGRLAPGFYLIHARSREGRAVYRLIQVLAGA
jgi:hypothetical protein